MNGATAARSSSQRSTGWTSQAEKEPRAPSMVTLRLSGSVSYQGRKTASARRAPPAMATTSVSETRFRATSPLASTAADPTPSGRDGRRDPHEVGGRPVPLAGQAQVQAAGAP